MGVGTIRASWFGQDGRPVGNTSNVYLPEFLDRMDIEAKAVWLIYRGDGEPEAKWVLLDSQGQQFLVPLAKPLRRLKLVELKENENGLQERVQDYIARYGIGAAATGQ